MAENYKDRSLEELQQIARERDLKGRSSLNKDELADALAEDDEKSGADDNAASQVEGGQNEKGGRGVAQTEGADVASRQDAGPSEETLEEYREEYVPQRQEENEQAIEETGEPLPSVGFQSEASDPDNPLVEEALEDNEAYQDMSDEDKELADLALDAFGPLNLESPYGRLAMGAVSEEQAEELEAERKKLPDNFVGDHPEKVTDEYAAAAEKALADPSEATYDEEKGEYAPNDPRYAVEFPPAFTEEELKAGREADKARAKLVKAERKFAGARDEDE